MNISAQLNTVPAGDYFSDSDIVEAYLKGGLEAIVEASEASQKRVTSSTMESLATYLKSTVADNLDNMDKVQSIMDEVKEVLAVAGNLGGRISKGYRKLTVTRDGKFTAQIPVESEFGNASKKLKEAQETGRNFNFYLAHETGQDEIGDYIMLRPGSVKGRTFSAFGKDD